METGHGERCGPLKAMGFYPEGQWNHERIFSRGVCPSVVKDGSGSRVEREYRARVEAEDRSGS